MTMASSQWCDVRALIGSIVYGCTISSHLYHIFHVLKFLAKHAFTTPTTPVKLWEEAQKQFNRAVHRICENKPRLELRPHGRIAVVTDAATETGLGAGIMVTMNGRIMTTVVHLREYKSINDMEAQAFYYTLKEFQQSVTDKSVEYYGDNTSVLYTLRAGLSSSYELNTWCGRIIAFLHDRSARLAELFFIPSRWNPADAPSRRARMSNEHSMVLRAIRNRTTRLRSVGVE